MDVIVLAFYEPILIFLFFLWQWWSLRKDKALLREQRKREAKEGLDVPGTWCFAINGINEIDEQDFGAYEK